MVDYVITDDKADKTVIEKIELNDVKVIRA
jgi:hypothetical protein